MPRWKDPELQAKIADMSAAGMSAAMIARRIRATRDATKNAMARYGLFADWGPGRRPKQGRTDDIDNHNRP